jgi:hypothetical protein
MERETGLEPATSSLGISASIDYTGHGVHGGDADLWSFSSLRPLLFQQGLNGVEMEDTFLTDFQRVNRPRCSPTGVRTRLPDRNSRDRSNRQLPLYRSCPALLRFEAFARDQVKVAIRWTGLLAVPDYMLSRLPISRLKSPRQGVKRFDAR